MIELLLLLLEKKKSMQIDFVQPRVFDGPITIKTNFNSLRKDGQTQDHYDF